MFDRCTLQYAAGRIEPCPGEPCPFWETRRLEAACVLDVARAELERRPGVAQHLLELRNALGRAADAAPARSLFHRFAAD